MSRLEETVTEECDNCGEMLVDCECTEEDFEQPDFVQALAQEPEWIEQLCKAGHEDQTHHASVVEAVAFSVSGGDQLHILEVGLSTHCTRLISALTVDVGEDNLGKGDTAVSVEEEWGQIFHIMRDGLQKEDHSFVNCRPTDPEGKLILDMLDVTDIVVLNGDPLNRRIWLLSAFNAGVPAIVLNFADKHLECGYSGIVVPLHYYVTLYVHKSGDHVAVFHKGSMFSELISGYSFVPNCAGTTWQAKGGQV